ncbi:IS3 family transposase [Pseudomonas aeruginosa]|uniref:IS3 family transposase n=1 Tax=Pseudomonas aeruginosa TaxID=287 RepID=UPI0038FCBAFC
MRFRAIEALAGRYPVAPMCRLLQVSRSGFYAWQQRPPSAREMANRRLSQEIRTIHHDVNGIYGRRRIKAELTAMGHACGRHRVARLMREAGLQVRSRKLWRLVSSSRHALPIAPNHLDRQFASDRANRHWVSDMTYVRTAQGWLYLAVVLDLYSRAVVGCPRSVDAGTDEAPTRFLPKASGRADLVHGRQWRLIGPSLAKIFRALGVFRCFPFTKRNFHHLCHLPKMGTFLHLVNQLGIFIFSRLARIALSQQGLQRSRA